MNTLARQKNIISSPVFATLIFVFVEIMFFSALFSSYFVIRRARVVWDIPGNIHLPVVASGFNSAVLFLSFISLYFAVRALQKGKSLDEAKYVTSAKSLLLRTIVLASLFAAFQIFLSLKLMSLGLTMTSSIFGACYFLMIGAHTIHVLFGIVVMIFIYKNLSQKTDVSILKALQVFWIFIVGIWPFLYVQLYF
jgi:heme/copper-type cytochrome/quinol oxidase subunit 3